MSYVIGVDLGGSKIYTVLADDEGWVLNELEVPTQREEGYTAVVERIAATVREVWDTSGLPGKAPAAIGLGAPGPLDAEQGIVFLAPNLGWRDVPLRDDLQRLLGVPVYLDNDGNLAALGEHTFGAGWGARDLLYVTVSTGIGGGLILGGQVYRGTGGAGEIGHITVLPGGPRCNCGNQGCLEAVASGTAIARDARELIEGGRGKKILELAGEAENVTTPTVAAAARAGDPEAQALLDRAARFLGIGLAAAVNLLSPELIILGGGVMKSADLLWAEMERELEARALAANYRRVRLARAALGGRAGGLGAVALALRMLATGG
ncbi:MAG: ROK family protein [Desulfotomaculales bacterium]